jgi:putative transcriptional regulator
MNYHPDIELLLKYANGQLEPALAIAIGLHQQRCNKCQTSIADIESIGGDNLEQSSDAELSSNSFEQLLAQLGSVDLAENNLLQVQPEQKNDSIDLTYSNLAVAELDLSLIKKLAEQHFENIKWRRVTNKISQSELELGDDSFKVELLKFKPNAKIPKHTHKGNEFTVVVQGCFKDHYGEYQLGDFILMNQKNEHQPMAGKDGCICLAITDKQLHFTGFFGPVINWLTR